MASVLAVLVFGMGIEEALPKVMGVGFPVLLAAAQFMAVRRPLPVAVIFALAAGTCEDSISALSTMPSVSYFLAVAILARTIDLPRTTTLLAYPLYQVWLESWTGGFGGGVFVRILVSLPIGGITALVAWALLGWVERKAAIGEAS